MKKIDLCNIYDLPINMSDSKSVIISFSLRDNDVNMDDFLKFFLDFFHRLSIELDIDSELPMHEYMDMLSKSTHILSGVLNVGTSEYIFHDSFYDDKEGAMSGSIPNIINAMIKDCKYDYIPYMDDFKIGYTGEQSDALYKIIKECDGLKYINMKTLQKYKPYIIKYTRPSIPFEIIEIVDEIENVHVSGYMSVYPICIF